MKTRNIVILIALFTAVSLSLFSAGVVMHEAATCGAHWSLLDGCIDPAEDQ
jgi:hypothetical protein